MTAITTDSRRGAHRSGRDGRDGRDGYRFGQVARMEWIKLRSQRGAGWTLAGTAAAMIALGVLIGIHQSAHLSAAARADYDPTGNGFAGLAFGELAIGVLGVLLMTSEYSSGLIKATLAAIPNRPLLLAAKAAVFGAVTLAAGELMAFATFIAMRTSLPATVPHPGLGQPAVLRAVIMAGAYLALAGLIGLGVGTVIRHTAGAVGAMVGLLYVVPLALLALPASVADPVEKFLPMIIAENSLTAVRRVSPSLPVWAGLGMLCLYVAVLLGAGGWLLVRRDA
ncbi:MAG TPA: hypothetical protein VGI31_09115 [Streptosporangiaceae bacterium]|jgi:hypothetical protein